MRHAAHAIVFAVLTAVLGGCTHVHPTTGLSYILHTDYAVFNVDEDPTHALSNYIGYCMLPMRDAGDVHAEAITRVLERYLQSNKYTRVTQGELLAEPVLQKSTFLVGMGYVESFAYETIQLQMDLYYIDPDTHKNIVFWSWKAKFDEYPVTLSRIEPAFKDLFCRHPIDWGRTDTIFPVSSPTAHSREVFSENLAGARLRMRGTVRNAVSGTAVEAKKLRGRLKDATTLPQKVRSTLRDAVDMDNEY